MYGTLIRFAAHTGLRAGEIGALRLGRLDLLRGKVGVAESLADVGSHLEFGSTKTYARRHVPLPSFLRDELRQSLALRPCSTDDLVFSAPRGGPLRHGLFYKRSFKPAVAAAGLPEQLRFHDLRHTYARVLHGLYRGPLCGDAKDGVTPRSRLPTTPTAACSPSATPISPTGSRPLPAWRCGLFVDQARAGGRGPIAEIACDLRFWWSPRSDSNRRPAHYE